MSRFLAAALPVLLIVSLPRPAAAGEPVLPADPKTAREAVDSAVLAWERELTVLEKALDLAAEGTAKSTDSKLLVVLQGAIVERREGVLEQRKKTLELTLAFRDRFGLGEPDIREGYRRAQKKDDVVQKRYTEVFQRLTALIKRLIEEQQRDVPRKQGPPGR